MPLLKATDPLPERPVIILIYGEPGIGKTTLINTSKNPIVINFDRAIDRALLRRDALLVNTWEDILQEEKSGLFKDYSTIGIDTAKAALDDYIMSYVVKLDYKNAKNKLAAYGAIGDHFKMFVSNRRSENADIIIVCHSKDDKDGDTTRKIPDVTGGSYQLLLRIADQVGYMSTKNNKRSIQWDPTDTTIGKNVARLPVTEIPTETDPSLKTFMASIIEKVKSAISSQSEAQVEALQKSEALQGAIKESENFEDLGLVIPTLLEQPQYLQEQIKQVLVARGIEFIKEIETVDKINEALTFFSTKPMGVSTLVFAALQEVQKKHGWKFNKEEKKFFSEAPPPAETSKDKATEPTKEPELAFN